MIRLSGSAIPKGKEKKVETRSSVPDRFLTSQSPYLDGVGALFSSRLNDSEESCDDEIDISGDEAFEVHPGAAEPDSYLRNWLLDDGKREILPSPPRLTPVQRSPWLPQLEIAKSSRRPVPRSALSSPRSRYNPSDSLETSSGSSEDEHGHINDTLPRKEDPEEAERNRMRSFEAFQDFHDTAQGPALRNTYEQSPERKDVKGQATSIPKDDSVSDSSSIDQEFRAATETSEGSLPHVTKTIRQSAQDNSTVIQDRAQNSSNIKYVANEEAVGIRFKVESSDDQTDEETPIPQSVGGQTTFLASLSNSEENLTNLRYEPNDRNAGYSKRGSNCSSSVESRQSESFAGLSPPQRTYPFRRKGHRRTNRHSSLSAGESPDRSTKKGKAAKDGSTDPVHSSLTTLRSRTPSHFSSKASDQSRCDAPEGLSVLSPNSRHELPNRLVDDRVFEPWAVLSGSGNFDLEDDAFITLLRIFQEHTDLANQLLKVDARLMIRAFAKDLLKEADKDTERAMSRFCLRRARSVAQRLGQDLDAHASPEPYQSDTGQKETNNDATHTKSLDMFRVFLVKSSAFQRFRERLEGSVLPKDLRPSAIESTVDGTRTSIPGSIQQRHLGMIGRIWQATLVAAGVLEPPLRPGLFRLRWQCRCGDLLFDDVREYREGGVDKLVEQMQRSMSSKITVASYNKAFSNQQYFPGLANRLRRAVRSFANTFWKPPSCEDGALRDDDLGTSATPGPVNIQMPPAQDLLLLGCVHKTHGGKGLRHDQIGAIESDSQLFHLIHDQLSRTREVHWSTLAIKTITGIHFTKFHLRLNNDVEPRLHKPCCRQDACRCIPLASNHEYDCTPPGPLDFGPPVLPQQMLHYFNHPLLIDEREKSILNQLPKRMCGELQANGQVPAEGWGLYYEENWNISLIIVAIVVATILASLLFGICWTLKKSDIQGAWGVSSYMITTCALVVALLSMMSRAKSE